MNNTDEEKHIEGNVMGFHDVYNSLTTEDQAEVDSFIDDIVKQYVEAEHAFIDMIFEMGPQEGMTKEDMKDYIRYLADFRLSALNRPAIYGVTENPLDWMSWMLSGRNHTNFFEARVTAYDHEGLVGDIDYSSYADLLEPTLY